MRIVRILTIIVLVSCASAYAQIVFTAKITSCADGDTCDFVHSDGVPDRLRMLGIDVPEVAHSSREISQPFGEICRNLLRTILSGKSVFIETERRDNYGRLLARVVLGDTDINLFMLRQGCAWSYYPTGIPAHLRADYAKAFADARTNKIGLFARKRVVSPTVWRRRKHLKRPAHKRIN